jgi:hypothetical protein
MTTHRGFSVSGRRPADRSSDRWLATTRGLVAAIALAACGGGRRASQPPGSRIGPAIAAALAAADELREPWRCAAPDGSGLPPETLVIGARTWQLGDRVMRLATTGDVAIGVIADAAGSAPATLAALGRLRAQLDHVDLVLSLGGMGATTAQLEAVFTALADHATWPLVAMPGDLEPVEAQAEAIAAARKRGIPVIDGRLVQRIEVAAVTIALVSGAGAASRLVASHDGCTYSAADVTAAFADLTTRPGLRILASAEPPRGGARDEPTGEVALSPGAEQQIDIAIHGPTTGVASPARSGRRDGSAVPLTPGPCDASPRLPGGRRSTAGVLTVHGATWAWKAIDGIN